MNKTITGILLALFILSLGYAVYLKNFKVSDLEDRVHELENLPPTIERKYIPGKTDTVFVVDTVTVYEPTSGPVVQRSETESPIKAYQTQFSDSLLTGTIFNTVIGQGYLSDAEVTYRFNQPIYTTQRIDTIEVTKTRTVVKFKPEDRPWRLQVGLLTGASPNPDMTMYLGPTAGFLTPQDRWIGYSYDVLNDAHLVSYRRTVKFDFIKNISLNPFN